jgi:hypothetical protein
LSNLLVLVERFVASFEKLDEMSADEVLDPIAWQLGTGDRNQYDRKRWRPIRVNTPLDALGVIYAKLPVRFPPLYEQLVLSHRWAEVDLQAYRLLANPPGPNLSGLLEEMSRDSIIWNSLRAAGYVQFGKGPDIDYDPICFDLNSRKKNRECRIVKIDHEQVLCHDRVKVIGELAPTFRQLVLNTIDKANTVTRKVSEHMEPQD